MSYDYQKLIDAGYSYGQISDFLGGELGVDVNRLRNMGYQESDITQFLSEYEKEEDSLSWLGRNLFAPIDKGWNLSFQPISSGLKQVFWKKRRPLNTSPPMFKILRLFHKAKWLLRVFRKYNRRRDFGVVLRQS